MPEHTIIAKYVLVPIVGASATGRFAMNAISAHPIAAASAVTVTSSALSIPACARIAGFTASMYDIAKNVASPASASRPTLEFLSPILKNLSIKSMFPSFRHCLSSER